MVRFQLPELAAACGGRVLDPDRPPGPSPATAAGEAENAVVVDGLSIDSRSIGPGQLFVPVVAERDGHDFIAAAVDGGAVAHLTTGPRPRPDVPAILVADTAAALTAIGRLARARLAGPVVAITGSVGKTSVKDLTLAACDTAGTAWASAASFNNELGVPLTLGNAPDGTEITVVEMGARGIGHIASLAEVARPTIGVVTAVALAHSELFGSLDGVAAAKGELVEALPPDGTAVLNADDPRVAAMASRTRAPVVTFGTSPAADVRATELSIDRLLRPTLRITAPGGAAEVTLQARGAHMAGNAAAAVAAALAAGVAFDDALAGLATARVSRWRMEVTEGPDGLVVINDAYNANPTSMRAAIAALLRVDAATRVAVVGLMAELGDEGPAEHAAVAAEATAAGIRVIAVDAPSYGLAAEHVAGRDQARKLLDDLGAGAGAGAGVAVLVKGSRVAGLEVLAQQLTDGH